MQPTLQIDPRIRPSPCKPILVWARDIMMPQSPPVMHAALKLLLERVSAEGDGFWIQGLKERVRAMLRYGRYRPSGRAKPSSEFLLNAAIQDRFPLINPCVDVNNFISLQSGFPASIFDADRSGLSLVLRRGQPNERYVFNPAGQEIDLTDLLLVARKEDDVPCGNPVKDSMTTKVQAGTKRVVGVLYAPVDEPQDRLSSWAERYAETLAEWCQAADTGYSISSLDAQ